MNLKTTNERKRRKEGTYACARSPDGARVHDMCMNGMLKSSPNLGSLPPFIIYFTTRKQQRFISDFKFVWADKFNFNIFIGMAIF
jgi:hypothetical protein